MLFYYLTNVFFKRHKMKISEYFIFTELVLWVLTW